jgi:hypothetical protein
MKTLRRIAVLASMLACAGFAWAGGPLYVGGPQFVGDGKVITWDPAKMPIKYRLDPGPLSTNASGGVVISNSAGAQRIQSMLGVWQGVSTAAVSFTNAGSILAAGSYTGGDVSTLTQYNAVVGSCKAASQNPVVFDANGSLTSALGMSPEVIGFTDVCAIDGASGHITAAMITLNGKMQDGTSSNTSPPNYELTANEFDEAITHEFGHFIGLDHAQINLEVLNTFTCDLDAQAGLPLMFPIEACDARKDVGLPPLAPDDISWVSRLYPGGNQNTAYGIISGHVLFSDGISAFQGANVIVRAVDDAHTSADESKRVAVSVISGYLFTGNPGQSFTADMADPQENNTGGSKYGSRNTELRGYYEVAVPPGTYTVEVESVDASFVGGSGMGPMLTIPSVSPEFWNQNESPFDYPQQRDTIIVNGGDRSDGNDIILNNNFILPTYDQFEDSGMAMIVPILPANASLIEGGL